MRLRLALPAVALVALLAAGCMGPASTQTSTSAAPPAATPPTFLTSKVVDGGFEPRIAVGPDGTRWVSTQDGQGNEVVYSSAGNGNWTRATDPQVIQANADNEVVVTPTGRVITATIAKGVTFDIQYSDDKGKTWTTSQGNYGEDQDREWLAVGGKDPVTGDYDVYMLWHNLVSGSAQHEMFVSTSRDDGATFGPPVPVALPGSQAWLDLQCADSGGPSNIVANNRTGQVYAIFGTRSSVAGGCGASVTGPFEINIVAATRVWVATSTDNGLTWTDSLAVDDSAAGNIVGMQVNAGTLDNQGNVYVVYPESPKPYPDYAGAGVKVVWSPPDLSKWSAPITVAPAIANGTTPGSGHLRTHIAAGDPGRFAAFFLEADPLNNGTSASWYPTVAETWNGLDANATFTTTRVSSLPAWNGTASQLMGVCNPLGDQPFPVSDVNAAVAGFTCGRSSDVYGQALTADCRPTFVWYSSSAGGKGAAGTYVTEQTGGPSLCQGKA